MITLLPDSPDAWKTRVKPERPVEDSHSDTDSTEDYYNEKYGE